MPVYLFASPIIEFSALTLSSPHPSYTLYALITINGDALFAARHLERPLGVDGSLWLDGVWRFKKYDQLIAAGMPDTWASDASAHQHRWRRGLRLGTLTIKFIYCANRLSVSLCRD